MKMTDLIRATDPPWEGRVRHQRQTRLLGVLVGVAVFAALLAGCGGAGSSGGGVAHVNPSTTSTGSSSSGAKPNAVAYAQCMRSHGVPAFPDPNSQGKFVFSKSMNTNSSAFQAASEGCKSLAPAGQTSSAGTTKLMSEALQFASCMRKNGVSNFPDPKSGNGGMVLSGGPGLDPNSPAFQRASKACRSFAPGGSAAGLSAPPPAGG
jgi:hypothetical protein